MVPHKLPGALTSVSSVPQGTSCFGEDTQYNSGLHQLTGMIVFLSVTQAGTQTDFMEQHTSPVSEGDTRPRGFESGSGSAVQGRTIIRRLDPEPSEAGVNVLQPGCGGCSFRCTSRH